MDNQYLHPNWKALATASLKWKVFVQAKEDTASAKVGKEKERETTKVCPSLTGEGAQRFYESLLESSSNQAIICKPAEGRGNKAKSTNRAERDDTEHQGSRNQTTTVSANGAYSQVLAQGAVTKCPRLMNKAFRCAQDNDVAVLRDLLNTGLNVNTKDTYGWSLLMVASCAGAKDAVKILLDAGARVGVRDSKGHTALYLATTKGHDKIIDMLISASKGRHSDGSSLEDGNTRNLTEGTETREFFCDVCNKVIKEATKKQHKTSIAHQFCLGAVQQQTMYGIPPSNKGYQLLVNHGWDEDRGLGPGNQGMKFPIKTVLKRDRMGLGNEQKSTPKVTHFGPADTSSVIRVAKPGERKERGNTLSKRERRRQIAHEKRKEIELRRELNDPDYP
ncbi:hypothetical protein Pcinc_032972 [Petrolisthes cinctipes]|uniref:G-patch domain-containing protein n=1 Tax=Petrolisthes cinctipes TaxID=88211 RepID=A0AAE1ETE7_PETCI|nr:hypothetical protein Pcinc_032972 [Petrolisthes cinctipes]